MLNCQCPTPSAVPVFLNGGWTDEAGFNQSANLYALDPRSKYRFRGKTPWAPYSAIPFVFYRKDGGELYQYRSARVAALFKPRDEFHASCLLISLSTAKTDFV